MVTISFSSTNSGEKEAEVQKRCWAWLGNITVDDLPLDQGETLQDYAYMVPNGTQLSGGTKARARYMASLKKQGFRNGVSDIVIAYPIEEDANITELDAYHGAYIELKRDISVYQGPAAIKNAIRQEQREWLERMRKVGYWVAVAYGFDDFKRLVRYYLNGLNPPPLDWAERFPDTE